MDGGKVVVILIIHWRVCLRKVFIAGTSRFRILPGRLTMKAAAHKAFLAVVRRPELGKSKRTPGVWQRREAAHPRCCLRTLILFAVIHSLYDLHVRARALDLSLGLRSAVIHIAPVHCMSLLSLLIGRTVVVSWFQWLSFVGSSAMLRAEQHILTAKDSEPLADHPHDA